MNNDQNINKILLKKLNSLKLRKGSVDIGLPLSKIFISILKINNTNTAFNNSPIIQ